ncbi:FecR family protein [Flavisphingomonas formosensis]|uniref:FecR family protein n=1 Tax=Flavisphingomonas formosensis TaxID=861534 RepID=UPI0012F9FBB3|nr:FecR domain-containing protein [Sphingomonas formosensis]
MTAGSNIDERLLDEAIAWHRALEGDDADWDGFTLWLEADPRHREAFDEIALIDRIVEEHAPTLRQLTVIEPIEPEPASPARRRWLVGSLAAALAFAVGIPAVWHSPADKVFATSAGETRQIALGNGASVDLAPASRLIARGGDTNRLELAAGDAYFDVAHDPARTLSIKAGDYAVSDIGTRFELNLAADAVTVAVAEGQVSVSPDGGDATQVAAGQQLVALRGAQGSRLATVDARDVGAWRQGRLVYNNTPLTVVAADISRYTGKTVSVDPAIRSRQFSGVLVIGDGSRLLANLADLMAVSYDEKGNRVRIRAADRR